MSEEQFPAAADGPPASQGKFRTVLIRIGIALLAGGLGYGAGRVQGWLGARDALEARDHAVAQAHRLEARRQLSLAGDAVRARNFGQAQAHVDLARTNLEQSPQAEDEEIEDLIGHLEATEIQAEQSKKQVFTLGQFTARLDELQTRADSQ